MTGCLFGVLWAAGAGASIAASAVVTTAVNKDDLGDHFD